MALTSAAIKFDVSASVPIGTVTSGQGSLGSATIGVSSYSGLSSGTGTGQADLVYAPSGQTVTTGAPLTIDLRGGTITTPDGATASFVKITSLTIVHRGTTGTVTVGGGTNPFIPSGMPALNPGGRFHIDDATTGIAVTNSSNDTLQISTTGTGVPIDILIIGRSA